MEFYRKVNVGGAGWKRIEGKLLFGRFVEGGTYVFIGLLFGVFVFRGLSGVAEEGKG